MSPQQPDAVAATVSTPQRRRRGRPPKLSRPAILAAAMTLIDRDGAEALTMRSLAAALGVEAMSLYRHVESKQALLDGIADQLYAQIEPRGVSTDWAAAVRGYASSVRGLARAHPRAFALVAPRGASALQPVEDLLASLRASGFTPARAVAAYRLVASYTRGYALAEIAGFALEEGTIAERWSAGGRASRARAASARGSRRSSPDCATNANHEPRLSAARRLHRHVLRQGIRIGRPATLHATAHDIERVEVGGAAVLVGEGRFTIQRAI
jgi:TetR/AcrR family tetracycline transcriptional repressor